MNIQLKNWSHCIRGADQYTPPELMVSVLSGNVYNHPNPRHVDGKEITTSPIVGKRNGLVVTKSGSEYELLDVDPEYERLFPNARERFFNTLQDV